MADETKPAKTEDKAKPADTKPEPAKAPEPAPLPTLNPADAALIAQVAAQVAQQMNANVGKPAARTPNSDKTVKGGKYIVNGVTLNAWGQPFKEDQDPAHDNPEMPKH